MLIFLVFVFDIPIVEEAVFKSGLYSWCVGLFVY